MKRAVITGLGPVSAIGTGREEFFDGLKSGRSGIKDISAFSTEKYASKKAAEIAGFDVDDYLENQKAYLDRSSQLAFAAMSLAIEDANVDVKALDRAATGLALGSAFGATETSDVFFRDFLQKGSRFVKPFLFPHTYANTAISLLAIDYGLNGYHMDFAAGAVSSGCAIVEGLDLIRQGRTGIVFAGGYEALSELLFAGHKRMGVLSPLDGEAERCAPFDRSRNGMILGEGSGMVVIEEHGHAVARGARIYAEIAGAGFVGRVSAGAPEDWIVRAMELAARDGGINKEEIDYVCASGNGSVELDRREAAAIREFLGSRADRIPVSSIKSMTGETLGAGGALQLIAGIGAMEMSAIPPTVNLADPESAGIHLVMGKAVEQEVRNVVVNTMDPGGSMVSLMVRRMTV